MAFGGAVKLTGESEYRRALSAITQNLREVASEMKVVTSSYDSNDKSEAALAAQSDVLNKKLSEQTTKLAVLQAQYASMAQGFAQQSTAHGALVDAYEEEKRKLVEIGKTLGESSDEYKAQAEKVSDLEKEVIKSTSAQDANEKSMSKMRQEINLAQADCNKTAREIDNLGKETEETAVAAQKAGDGYTVFKGILANLGTQAINAAVSGLKKLGGGFVSLVKQSTNSYAQYEQLVGGVETLFGESSDKLIEYAENAYKTAGVSANEYMEQATSFSATLLQGLGGDTEAAVEYANLAIIDMSDNANKMGTSMQSIQNAYQGFAKNNYTINLMSVA